MRAAALFPRLLKESSAATSLGKTLGSKIKTQLKIGLLGKI